MEIKTSDIADAFDEFTSGYDLYGDEWQDMGLEEVFAAGYKSAKKGIPVADYKYAAQTINNIYGASQHCECASFGIAQCWREDTHGGEIPISLSVSVPDELEAK